MLKETNNTTFVKGYCTILQSEPISYALGNKQRIIRVEVTTTAKGSVTASIKGLYVKDGQLAHGFAENFSVSLNDGDGGLEVIAWVQEQFAEVASKKALIKKLVKAVCGTSVEAQSEPAFTIKTFGGSTKKAPAPAHDDDDVQIENIVRKASRRK